MQDTEDGGMGHACSEIGVGYPFVHNNQDTMIAPHNCFYESDYSKKGPGSHQWKSPMNRSIEKSC